MMNACSSHWQLWLASAAFGRPVAAWYYGSHSTTQTGDGVYTTHNRTWYIVLICVLAGLSAFFCLLRFFWLVSMRRLWPSSRDAFARCGLFRLKQALLHRRGGPASPRPTLACSQVASRCIRSPTPYTSPTSALHTHTTDTLRRHRTWHTAILWQAPGRSRRSGLCSRRGPAIKAFQRPEVQVP